MDNTNRNILIGVVIAVIVILGIILIVRARHNGTIAPGTENSTSTDMFDQPASTTTAAGTVSGNVNGGKLPSAGTKGQPSNVNPKLPTQYFKD